MKKFPFIKTAPLFDKRALGQARRVVGGGRIPPNQKLFLTLLIQIKRNFSGKGHFLMECPIPGCFFFLKQALTPVQQWLDFCKR